MSASAKTDTGAPLSARRVSGTWRRLAAPSIGPGGFEAGSIDALPAPVRRWLSHVVEPGTPLSTTVVVSMSGRIRIGAWRRFTARQVVAAGTGYIWAATARFGPVPVLGYDRYSEATGEMRWRLAGIVPVLSAVGEDVRRSAAGRLASELVLTPAAALASFVEWEAIDDEHARARLGIDGTDHDLTIAVDEQGALRSVRLPRWGDPTGDGFAWHEFVVRCTGDQRFGGYQLPAHVHAGWDLAETSDAEPFIEFDIDAATFI